MHAYIHTYIHICYIYVYIYMSDSIVLGILVHEVCMSILETCKCCGTFQESTNLSEEDAGGKN